MPGPTRPRQPALAKTSRPAVDGVFPRSRLFRVLDRRGRRPVVWVAGPPGAGKTTLVASYLDARRLPALWYQLDDGDSDVATFFYYMRLAAMPAALRRRSPLPLFTPEYRAGLAAFTRRYFDELYGRLEAPFALVLDNYQEVAADSLLHEVMREALARLPEQGRAILISRGLPPPPLARLRASRALQVVGAEDLRLTPGESRGIVRQRGRRLLEPGAVRALHEMTEGWAAGLVLMVERLTATRPSPRSVAREAPEEIFDYFAGELFLRTDRETRDLLLQTAFLPRMTAGMAEALTGSARAGRILADLARKNYFTTTVAGPDPVYEYHPLFRQFLRARAEDTFAGAALTRLRQAAAAVLEAAGQVEDAAALFRAAQDWAGLARLVGTQAPLLLAQGRNQTLEDWLGGVPEAVLETTPWLLYWLGLCRLPFDLPAARRRLEQAFARFDAADHASGLFLAWAGIVDTFIYEWGDLAPLDRWIAVLAGLVARFPTFPSPEIEARVTTGMFCALIYRQPDHPDLPLWEERVRALVLGRADARLRMMLAHHLILYYTWWSTDMAKADLLMDALRPGVGSAELLPLARIAWHATEAAYRWMKGDHAACAAAVHEGLEVARTHGVHVWDFMLHANGSWGRLTSDDVAGAEPFLQKMASALGRHRRMDVAHYHFQMYLAAWHRDDAPRAAAHARAAVEAAVEAGAPWVEGILRVGLARVLLAHGAREEAATQMQRARAIARGMRSRSNEYLCLLAEAELGLDGGDRAAGLAALRAAMAIGREQGIVNHAWWRGPVMSRLCAEALRAGIEVDYVRHLVRARGLVPPAPPLELEAWPWAVQVFTLGRFELLTDGRRVTFAGKAQHRPLALLKALIAFGGREVREAVLAEALWPDAEADAAEHALETTLHRLRRLLGHDAAVQRQDGFLSLDPRRCWVDAGVFERLLAEAATLRRAAADGAALAEGARCAERALALYRGPFLPGDDAEAWTTPLRERLHGKALRHLGDLGQRHEHAGAWPEAVACYERALDLDPCAEEFYRRLIRGYQRLGRRAEALALYERCRKTLAGALGVPPSPETEALHRSLRGSAA